jgi:hypothetical protein
MFHELKGIYNDLDLPKEWLREMAEQNEVLPERRQVIWSHKLGSHGDSSEM